MKISRSFALYAVMLGLVVLGAASALGQTNFNLKLYAEDGTGWKDSVIIGRNALATNQVGWPLTGDSLSPELVENELPPLPPSGPAQAPDVRLIDPALLGTYGQGVRVDIRLLGSDQAKTVYRMQFRRTDPNGIPVVLTWQNPPTISGVGFYMTDGFGGFFFPSVDMSATNSFTHASFDGLGGSFVDIIVGKSDMHRTFTATEIALAADQKGKVGKYEKPKPISVDFKFTLTVPAGGADFLYLAFDKIVEATVSFPGDFVHLPINLSALKVYELTIPGAPLDAGQLVVVEGNGAKGKPMKTKSGFTLAGSKLVKTDVAKPYDYEYLRLPQPNINNIGDEMYLQSTILDVGLASSIGLNIKLKPIIHHISHPKWKDVTKTLYKFKNVTILQNGPSYCLDTLNSKENIKMLKALPPDKTTRVKDSGIFGNMLLGELVALKFNIAASDKGHTPATGFGNLLYTSAGHPFDGATVNAIADSGDNALACAGGLPVGWSYQDMADFLLTLNEEFSGPWDTASWSGVSTVASGIKPVSTSMIFTYPGASYAPAAPADYSSLYDVPKAFSLSQNYPNPFNPTTTIEFTLPEDAIVSLRVYNMLGQEVATLADREEFSAGENWVELDGSKLSTGVYYYRIVVNDGQFQELRKMVLMK